MRVTLGSIPSTKTKNKQKIPNKNQTKNIDGTRHYDWTNVGIITDFFYLKYYKIKFLNMLSEVLSFYFTQFLNPILI